MDLSTYSDEELLALLQRVKYQNKYDKLSTYQPYEWQKKFYKASKDYKQRYLRAGNRCGKSYSQAFEFAIHITGQYPDWYEGAVIEDSGHSFWAVGYDLTSTANVLQNELLGTNDIGLADAIGSGSIPRDCIDFDSMRKDGKRLIQCRIKHKDGGFNTLMFYAQQQGDGGMMGQSVKYAWQDEEHEHQGGNIYNQLVARTVEAEGYVVFTSTPEAGLTELNRRFEENKTGGLYLQQVTWDDVPHLTDDMRKQILAGVAEWQHDLRIKGLPVIGSGAVFPFDDSDLMVDAFPIPDHYLICAGIDIGHTNDSSTVMYAAKDPDTDTYYLINEWEGENAKDPSLGNPDAMARFINNSAYSSIPVVAPHDSGAKSGAPEAYATKLRDKGINVSWDVFHNPYDSKVGIDSLKKQARNNNPETGLVLMRQLMAEGKFKVFRHCDTWFNEKRSYYYKENGDRSKPDHMQDAGRLAIVSLLANRGIRADQCTGFTNNGFTNYEDEATGVPVFN
ncbi:terminase family protein [Vibrio breoganii]